MSRTPSIYSDALEHPIQDIMNRPQEGLLAEQTSQSSRIDPMDQDVEGEQHAGTNEHRDESGISIQTPNVTAEAAPSETVHQQASGDMDVDTENNGVDNDVRMQSSSEPGQSSSSALDDASAEHHDELRDENTTSEDRQGPDARSDLVQGSAAGSGAGLGSAAALLAGRRVSVPVVDEKAQSELRRKIMDIQRDPNIKFADKAGLIQKLMSSKWQGMQRESDDQSSGSGEATEDDLRTTYHNEDQKLLGCKHYTRGCKLKANCCGKWFNCRFCHDDVSNHAIVRSETRMMLCMHCQTTQEAAQNCSSCNACLARYYCDICKLWDDDAKKNIYHCEDCGICRIGQGLGRDYFHCKKCNVCMNIHLQGNHKCIERNLECDCPICGEYMFTSTTTVIFMPCGHCIHSRCHEDYIKTSYQCPTCWKALGDMSAYYSKIDTLLAEQTMPPEYANIFSVVLCNDCEVKSEAPYHFLYHKCDKCKGYNTKVLETFKRVTDGQIQVVENATATAAPENNISATISGHVGPSSATGAGPSSTLSPGVSNGASSSTTAGVAGGSINVTPVTLPRSPLMDENASGDMSMAGISDNSAP